MAAEKGDSLLNSLLSKSSQRSGWGPSGPVVRDLFMQELMQTGDLGAVASGYGAEGRRPINGTSRSMEDRDRARGVSAALSNTAVNNNRTVNLQNALLGEQLEGAQMQNAQAKSKRRGSSFGEASPVGGMGGGFRNPVMTQERPNKYLNSLYRDERERDMELNRDDYAARAAIDARFQEEERQKKLGILAELLKRFRGGETATGVSTTTGGQYQNIGGRPVYMPTSERTETSQTKPISKMDILRLLDLG